MLEDLDAQIAPGFTAYREHRSSYGALELLLGERADNRSSAPAPTLAQRKPIFHRQRITEAEPAA